MSESEGDVHPPRSILASVAAACEAYPGVQCSPAKIALVCDEHAMEGADKPRSGGMARLGEHRGRPGRPWEAGEEPPW